MKNDNQNITKAIDGELIPASPTPDKVKRLRLGTLKEIRREMATVYREARLGKMPTQEATRLVYVLIAVENMIKDSDLEERITKLEQNIK